MDLQRLDLNLIKIFKLLLEERQVSRAAQRLHLSQPALSHSLKRLREVFQDPLFVQVGREMQPTSKALLLQPTIEQAWQTLELGLTQVTDFDPASSERQFKIAVSSSVEYAFVPMLYNILQQAGPGLRLEVFELREGDYWQSLNRRELDLVVGIGKGEHLSAQLDIAPWLSESLVCLHRADHVLEERSAQALLSRPHVYTSSWGHSQSLTDDWLAHHGVQRSIALRVPSFMALPKLLEQHDLLAVIPEGIGRLYAQQAHLAVTELDAQLRVGYCLACHPIYRFEPALRWFIQECEQLADSLTAVKGV